jgi:hypothetical protein
MNGDYGSNESALQPILLPQGQSQAIISCSGGHKEA